MKNIFGRKAFARLLLTVGLVISFVFTGCIKNDLPYPRLQQNIRRLAVEGESQPASIDSAKLTATVYLSEDVDIMNVKFSEFETSPQAKVDPNLLEGTYDMSNPLKVTLSLYQDYEWVVSAEQVIQRYVEIYGQIGTSAIDEVARRIIVQVPSTENLSRLTLVDAKLGPAGITTTVPALTPGPIDLSQPLKVAVTCFGRTEEWTIYAEKTELLVNTTAVDAWSCVVWAYGSGPANSENTFRYREVGADEWITVAQSEIQSDGGNFQTCIKHLKPLTDYEVQSVSGEDLGNIVRVTTQSTELIPDGDFDQWWQDGVVWCPWNQNGERYWDTGNKGTATVKKFNVSPSDHLPPGITSGYSAKLETLNVIIKLAAGSIFTGSFASIDGTNGILDFGRPWTVRPTKLKGYFEYTTANITMADADHAYMKGRPDSCQIYVALTDWTAPYQIRTNPKNRQLFNPNSPEIIAYGELTCGETTGGYRQFTIELKYNSTSRQPRYLQITCAGSKYGDYFTGGPGATMYVDQLSFDYDY